MAPQSRPQQQVSELIRACEQVASGRLHHRVVAPATGDEFEELAHGFNHMLNWFCALLETTRDANNALAHHMRTPLSSLRLGMSALAAEAELSPSARARIERQIEQVDALIGMFDHVLLIAKAESRAGTELFEAFDLRALVRDTAALYEPVLEEKGMRLRCTLPAEAVRFVGDRQLIAQALTNLLDNVCKHAYGADEVEIGLQAGRGEVLLAVCDRGQGIPPGMVETVKQRFVRGPGQASGFGLGLSLVSAVAALHHGALELADNAPGLRATMWLRSSNPA